MTPKGTYGFFAEATVPGNPPMLIVSSGIITYDGRGNISGESVTNLSGLG